jgi:hypothetical protein
VRQAARRVRYWVIALLVALAVVVASLVITGALGASGTPLSPTSAGPAGSKAIAEVLRRQGVEVTAAESFDEAREAAARARASTGSGSTTVFLVDDDGILDANQLRTLARLADRFVLMTPGLDALEAVAPGIAAAGSVDGVLEADCDAPAVRNAGSVDGEGSGYRFVDPAIADAGGLECLGSGDDVYSLVESGDDSGTVTVVGTRKAFSNEHVAEYGNAAFALTVLGANQHLVWYLPTIGDATVAGAPTIADLTPVWLTSVLALLVLVVIAAGFWRGRRLGPLVVENLPVTVRASETMEGRARLYARSGSRRRALDALRVGTVGRLGALCGLPRAAGVDEVLNAVAAATGRPLPQVRDLLLDAEPATDAELVRLSDALLDLEAATASAVRPAPQSQTPRPDAPQPHDEPGE